MTTADSTPIAPARPRRRGGFAAKLSLIVALVFTIALVIFVLQNTVHENVNFLGWNFGLPQGVWLLGAAAVGSIITLAAAASLRVRRAVR
ncbi:DUF1049 domain-containing protein [Rhodococcus sp. BP-252]|uniref:LapA family protein n=1 Tax=unclassified Rhodococcus (in: high G+C Gram-positive bacteria) TaxID=192944 RepID=UPI000DF236E0|nr:MULTISPECIES: DUF1049 domain-containing protein [unclassified Rhodococcus (in: high G+C Gram-positive bacteria)]MBY6410306.1 DUF1049 domain-containing protein [Rhodococcus sp. BP-320]MBY6416188.1 DUF1049 domain-containing protein [Rhodococcus sp. BP-321]MBY6420183.1 DUF1049 domain-containing protein [Rhodococcus sp. BP-324]MBY6424862.1 DUF1049 domain-containing protein [Rhodococcus sp. BP-323]MBY6430432.1 DUF1049 domain-containing protein [Rhodococcus sp. BP-322]